MTRPKTMYQPDKPRKNAAAVKDKVVKRKRVVLTFVQREEISKKLKLGYSVKKLALDYNVGERTVYDIRSVGDEKLVEYRVAHPNSLTRSTFKGSDFPLVDLALQKWFYQARAQSDFVV